MSARVTIAWATLAAFAGALPDDLAEEERARAAAIPHSATRDRFIAGRLLLRGGVAPVLGIRPAALRLRIDANGRPRAPDHPHLSFSLTHSAAMIAAAWSLDTIVGLDLEEADRRTNWREAAAITFTAAEMARLAAARAHDVAFLRIWSAKEAVAKANGSGFRADPHRFGLLGSLPEPDGPAVPARDIDGVQWWVRAVPIPGAACSLACATAEIAVSLRRFPDGD